MMESFDKINSNINKLFQNPNINFFIIMMLILLISCYTFINTSLKYAVSSFISNPIIILFILICVILVGYYNINIAVLILLLLFIILYSTTIFNNKTNSVEGFSGIKLKTNYDNEEDNDDNDDSDSDSDSDIEEEKSKGNGKENGKGKGNGNGNGKGNGKGNDESDSENEFEDEQDKKLYSQIKKSSHKKLEEDEKKNDDTVLKIKNTIMGTMNNFKDVGNSEFQKSLIENKQIQYLNEKKLNKQKFTNINNINSMGKSRSRSGNKNNKKENFQTIDVRKFDPNKEEDTNLLITKEILQDMNNRINYNFESSKYLKKYLKHRIEEIVDMNKLLDDE